MRTILWSIRNREVGSHRIRRFCIVTTMRNRKREALLLFFQVDAHFLSTSQKVQYEQSHQKFLSSKGCKQCFAKVEGFDIWNIIYRGNCTTIQKITYSCTSSVLYCIQFLSRWNYDPQSWVVNLLPSCVLLKELSLLIIIGYPFFWIFSPVQVLPT